MVEVVVVGGGLVGVSAAYRLACRGAHATLVDRADAGQATAAGAGIISPGNRWPRGSVLLSLVRQRPITTRSCSPGSPTTVSTRPGTRWWAPCTPPAARTRRPAWPR